MGEGSSGSAREKYDLALPLNRNIKKERKECKQVTLVKWLIAGELLDIYVVFLKKHSSREKDIVSHVATGPRPRPAPMAVPTLVGHEAPS
jgi:hypothetical protein